MQTNFTPEQLEDPGTARANQVLRACVHCGFCTATCPTYQVLGDELDSPRGRIYLIKDMLEQNRPADEKTVRHLDRCLSCLSCMSTCPSGVHYMHLIDHARVHVEKTYRRPWRDRALRSLLAWVLPHPGRFRMALVGAKLARKRLTALRFNADDVAAVATLIAFAVGYLIIGWFMHYISNRSYSLFVWYRIILGIVLGGQLVGHTVSSHLLAFDFPFIDKHMRPYFRDIAIHVNRLLEDLTGLREMADHAIEIGLLLESSRQSLTQRKFAAWAAILAVPTAVAGFYGMNFENMPELHWRYGYLAVLLGVATACSILFVRFRRAGWI